MTSTARKYMNVYMLVSLYDDKVAAYTRASHMSNLALMLSLISDLLLVYCYFVMHAIQMSIFMLVCMLLLFGSRLILELRTTKLYCDCDRLCSRMRAAGIKMDYVHLAHKRAHN